MSSNFEKTMERDVSLEKSAVTDNVEMKWGKFQVEPSFSDFNYLQVEEETRNTLTVCPTCKGSGFYDGVLPPIELKESRHQKQAFKPDCELPVALPKIKHPPNFRSKSHQPKSAVEPLPVLPSKNVLKKKCSSKSDSHAAQEKLPPITGSRSRLSSASTERGDQDLIMTKEIDNKPDFIRRIKMKLKSSNIQDNSEGVVDVVHLAKIDETSAYSFMPQVNRHLCEMLRSLKVKIVRQACQSISQLFGRVSHISRPEFDEIVFLLVIRTADSKKNVRKDAECALDVIVASTPPQVVVRAIHAKGPRSKNPHVRLTTAKIMCTLVQLVGYETLLTHQALHEMRKRVLETGCVLLDDQNTEVRSVGRDLMSNFVTLSDFEDALLYDVAQPLIKRVEKSIVCLRVELLKTADILKTTDLPLQ